MITDEQLKSWRRKIVLDAGSYTPEFEGEAVEAFILLVDEVERLRGVVRDLAERPMLREASCHGSTFDVCAFCNTDSDKHRESCLYRRAIEATKDGSR